MLQEKLSSSLQATEKAKTELNLAKNNLALVSSQHALRGQQITESELLHAIALDELRSALKEQSAARTEAETRQQELQESMQQAVAENNQLKERLSEQGNLILSLRAEMEEKLKTANVREDTPERKEQVGIALTTFTSLLTGSL